MSALHSSTSNKIFSKLIIVIIWLTLTEVCILSTFPDPMNKTIIRYKSVLLHGLFGLFRNVVITMSAECIYCSYTLVFGETLPYP